MTGSGTLSRASSPVVSVAFVVLSAEFWTDSFSGVVVCSVGSGTIGSGTSGSVIVAAGSDIALFELSPMGSGSGSTKLSVDASPDKSSESFNVPVVVVLSAPEPA